MWNHNNVLFNVNGIGKDALLKTLQLALGTTLITHWRVTKEGLVLCDRTTEFDGTEADLLTPVTVDVLIDLIWTWLHLQKPEEYTLTGWDIKPMDGDDNYTFGWRVFTGDFGKVLNRTSLCIKPVWIWA